MKTKRKSQKPKREKKEETIADAPASGDRGARARKEAFDLTEADNIHDLMTINGPKVAKWALQCVQKAARGRASLFEQKIALMMIQKSTPSTGRKGDETPEELPEGASKEEMLAIDALLRERKDLEQGASRTRTRATRDGPEASTYQIRGVADE